MNLDVEFSKKIGNLLKNIFKICKKCVQVGKKCGKISKDCLKSGHVYALFASIAKRMFYFEKSISDSKIVALL